MMTNVCVWFSSRCHWLLQGAVELVKFVYLADEEIAIATSYLGVRNVYHVLINVEVHL
jgi:hypothetical protein